LNIFSAKAARKMFVKSNNLEGLFLMRVFVYDALIINAVLKLFFVLMLPYTFLIITWVQKGRVRTEKVRKN